MACGQAIPPGALKVARETLSSHPEEAQGAADGVASPSSAVGGRRACLKPPEPLRSLRLGLGPSVLSSFCGGEETHRHPFSSVLFTPSPGAQPAVPMATVSSGWGQGGGQSPEWLPRREKWGQMGAADCDGRWGHQAGNLRAWLPLSLKRPRAWCRPTPASPPAPPPLLLPPRPSSCPPPRPAERLQSQGREGRAHGCGDLLLRGAGVICKETVAWTASELSWTVDRPRDGGFGGRSGPHS